MGTNDDDTPASVYGGQVAEIIAAQSRESTYQPAAPVELFVKNRRQVTELDQLGPDERVQFTAMFPGEDVAQVLRDGIEDMPLDLEVAEIVDDSGAVLYRLFGWNFGVIWLMPPSGLDVVGFAAQHDVEHWHVDQRPIFWALDRALRRRDHGFQQASKFCWWDEKCWDEIKDLPAGTVRSEPYIRKQMAGKN
jgi:hypothetical protein